MTSTWPTIQLWVSWHTNQHSTQKQKWQWEGGEPINWFSARWAGPLSFYSFLVVLSGPGVSANAIRLLICHCLVCRLSPQLNLSWFTNEIIRHGSSGTSQIQITTGKGVGKRSPNCACVCVHMCVCLCWSGNSLAFSALFTLLWPESEKQDHTRAGAKLENGEEKKAAEQPRKTALQEKFQFPKGSQREWQRVIRDISENLYWLQSSQWGGFSGQDSCASEQLPLLGNFGQQDSRYASADCLEGKVEGPFPTDIRAYRNLKIF